MQCLKCETLDRVAWLVCHGISDYFVYIWLLLDVLVRFLDYIELSGCS